MTREELMNLEKLMNYIANHFLKKPQWEDVSKVEWTHIGAEFNQLMQKKTKGNRVKDEPLSLGDNYFYEHLIIKKLKPWKKRKSIATLGTPNFKKLNKIAAALGYTHYIDFINNSTDSYSFHELKINIPVAQSNTLLLDHLIGYWYCYNRNLPEKPNKKNGERIWRSTLEIYKSGNEYLVERSGKDNHMYYGKITSYADYVFIILNSTTFIRQRHFIGRIKDVTDKLRRPGFRVQQVNFVSTCVSFNEEPIALYEIFDRVSNTKNVDKTSIDFPLDSTYLPKNILELLKDVELNRITEH